MAHTWKHDRALEHIKKKIKDVETVNIATYTRDVSLERIPSNKAYRLDGVHIYADILNLSDMLSVTQEEGETCHKRTLRFLNLHYRAVHRILKECDTIRVDFHNQRLHAVVAKPYNTVQDAEKKRIQHAVAISQLIVDVLAETGDDDEHIPNAKVRIGIDSGEALAVNNGRNGGREPLFLGDPANHAAKIAGAGKAQGIFLTNNARKALGLKEAEEPKTTPLTPEEIQSCQEQANLAVSKETIVKEWRKDLKDNPIGVFEFSRHTPPLRTMDIAALSPANSRRQEAISIYADIDGFTAYVSRHLKDSAEDVVRVFHVIRSELDRVLMTEFEGRRIRFIGDCVHGLICEGTAKTTEEEETVSNATLCSGGLRSSFELSLETLSVEGIDTDGLGLAIGFELGPMTVTRLGMQGDRIRCSVSRGVLGSEKEQTRCNGVETAIGRSAYDAASEAVKSLFGPTRKVAALDYNEIVESLSEKGDRAAGESKAAAYAIVAPAIAKSAKRVITPHARVD